MSWMLIAAMVWVTIAVPLALLISVAIHHADEVDCVPDGPTAPDFVPAEWSTRVPGAR